MISRLLLVLVVLASLPAMAAEPFARVLELAVPDPRGRWRSAETTAAAHVLRGEERLPLAVGLELAPGDRILTREARATIGLREGETLTVGEGAELVVGDRSVLQELGEACFRVRGAFTVGYREVEATVEGTEFRFAAGDEVAVAVVRGRVRVKGGGEPVVLGPGDAVSLPAAGSAGTPAVPHTGLLTRQALLASAWGLGRPRVVVGALGAFTVGGRSAGGEARFFSRFALLPGLGAVGDLGAGGGTAGARFPLGAGLELGPRLFAFGGQVVTATDVRRRSCGGVTGWQHTGFVGTARLSLSLTRRFSLEASARGGYLGSLHADGAFGAGFAL